MEDFREELEHLINSKSLENGSNTPDFLLAEYLVGCLKVFDSIVAQRDQYYNIKHFDNNVQLKPTANEPN
jgi:hypothetical protein